MNCSFRFNSKRFKSMSKKRKLIWLLIVIIFLFLLFRLFFSEMRTLIKTQQIEIRVENAVYIPSISKHSALSSEMYKIESDDAVYYFTFCPFSEEYAIFLDRLESDLLAGDIKSISATVATRQELDSWIRGQYRILAFSVDGIEYLSVESTKKHLIKNDMGAFFAFLLCGILPLVSLLFEFHLLGIIKYQKTRKRNK